MKTKMRQYIAKRAAFDRALAKSAGWWQDLKNYGQAVGQNMADANQYYKNNRTIARLQQGIGNYGASDRKALLDVMKRRQQYIRDRSGMSQESLDIGQKLNTVGTTAAEAAATLAGGAALGTAAKVVGAGAKAIQAARAAKAAQTTANAAVNAVKPVGTFGRMLRTGVGTAVRDIAASQALEAAPQMYGQVVAKMHPQWTPQQRQEYLGKARQWGSGANSAYWTGRGLMAPGKIGKAIGLGMGAMGMFNMYAQGQNPTQYYTLQEIQQDPSRLDRMPKLTEQQRTVMTNYQQQLNNPAARLLRPLRSAGQNLYVPYLGPVGGFIPQGNKAVDMVLGRTQDTYNLHRTQQDRAAAHKELQKDPNNPVAKQILENTPQYVRQTIQNNGDTTKNTVYATAQEKYRSYFMRPQSQQDPAQLQRLRIAALQQQRNKGRYAAQNTGLIQAGLGKLTPKSWVQQDVVDAAKQKMQLYKQLSQQQDPVKRQQIAQQLRYGEQPGAVGTQALKAKWSPQMRDQVVQQVVGDNADLTQLQQIMQGQNEYKKWLAQNNLQQDSDQYTSQISAGMKDKYVQNIKKQIASTNDPIGYAQKLLMLKQHAGEDVSKLGKQLYDQIYPRVKQQIWKDPINNLPQAIKLWGMSKGYSKQFQNLFGSKSGLWGTVGLGAGLLVGLPLLFSLFSGRSQTPQVNYKDAKFQQMLDQAVQMNMRRQAGGSYT